MIKRCLHCTKEYITTNNRQKYCSNECKNTVYDNNRKKDKRYCILCGKEFYSRKDFTTKTCSKDCRYIQQVKERKGCHYTDYFKEHNIIDIGKWLKKEYIEKQKGEQIIAEEIKTSRSVIKELLKKYKITIRTQTETNQILMARRTPEENKKNSRKAHKKLKELWATDDEWRKQTLKNMIESQITQNTSIEIAIEKELKKLGIEYKKQHIMARFIIDFTIPSKKIAIECDGDYWHALPKQIEKDKKKDHWLNSHNWKILRLSETEINKDIESCIKKIKDLLKLP